MGSQHEGGSLIPHKPMCTLYHSPSISQTPFPRGLVSIADLLDSVAPLYPEPRFNFFVNTTSAVNMLHLHPAPSGGLRKENRAPQAPRSARRRRHRSILAPVKLGSGGMWWTPCRNRMSVGAIQGSWSLYAGEHNTTRLGVIKSKDCEKSQPWQSIDQDISY